MIAKSNPRLSPSFILRHDPVATSPQPLKGPHLRLVVVEDTNREHSQRRGNQQEAAQQHRPQTQEEFQLGHLRPLAKHSHRAQETIHNVEVDGGLDSAVRFEGYTHKETTISRTESTAELVAGWSLAKLFQETAQKYAAASTATLFHSCGGSTSEVTPMLRERNERRLPERSDDEDDAEHRVQEHVDKTHGDEHGGGADAREVVATQVEDVEEGGESGEEEQAEDEAVDGDHLRGVDAHANEPEEETHRVAGEKNEVEEVTSEHRCGKTAKGVLGRDCARDLGVVGAIVASR